MGKGPKCTLPAAVALVALLAIPPAASAGVDCETAVVRDYLDAPFLNSPQPQSGAVEFYQDLPFGPPGLSLGFPLRLPQSVVLESEELGFQVVFRKERTGGAPNPKVNWLVTAKLARVDRSGRVVRELSFSRKHITRLGGESHDRTEFPLPFRFSPGLYRVEIVFRDGSGRRLGRFVEFRRAIRPTVPDDRLALNGTSFHPGETVSAGATEYGVGITDFRDIFSIEKLEGTTWTPASISPGGVSLLLPGPTAGPGEGTAVGCWNFKIPAEAPPGQYRFVVGASAADLDGRPFPRAEMAPATAEFQIVPPG